MNSIVFFLGFFMLWIWVNPNCFIIITSLKTNQSYLHNFSIIFLKQDNLEILLSLKVNASDSWIPSPLIGQNEENNLKFLPYPSTPY